MSSEKRRLMSEPATKETADLVGFATGVSAAERVVPVFLAGALDAELNLLDIAVADAKEDGDVAEVERLQDERRALVQKIRKESRVLVRLRGLSPSKAAELVEEAKERGLSDDDGWYFLLANQIVSPTGWDFEALKEMRDKHNPEIQALIAAAQELNLQARRGGWTVPLS